MAQPGGITVRRLIFPLIIVGVAIGLGVWSTQAGGARSDVVERFIKRLCLEIADGGDGEILLGRTEALVAAGVRQQIALVCESQGGQVERIDIDIYPGDIQPYPGSETATHSALIGDGKISMLGLRVVCRDDSSAVKVLGYWIPISD